MTTVIDFDVTLRLRWGVGAVREIVVPIEHRKGNYSGRWELYLDGVHVGWVVKNERMWEAYTTATQLGLWEDYQGRRVAIDRTRRGAVEELIFRLSLNAHTNALAARAEAAYADENEVVR